MEHESTMCWITIILWLLAFAAAAGFVWMLSWS